MKNIEEYEDWASLQKDCGSSTPILNILLADRIIEYKLKEKSKMNDEIKLDYNLVYLSLKSNSQFPRPMINRPSGPRALLSVVDAIMEGRWHMTDEQAYADLGKDNKETTGWLYQMYKYR